MQLQHKNKRRGFCYEMIPSKEVCVTQRESDYSETKTLII